MKPEEEELKQEETQTEVPTSEEQVETPQAANEEEKQPEEQQPAEPTAEEQIAEWKDKYLRMAAEFDNYRKRMMKERAELVLGGSEKAVKELLPVLDDMERAILASAKTEDVEALRSGMQLIGNKFWKALERLGVSVIATEDADFNTDLHEAVALVPGMGDDKKGKIIDCTQKGYKLNDKVIRFAQVAVGQ